MVVRMWHGRVPANKALAYREFTKFLLEFKPTVVHYEVVGHS